MRTLALVVGLACAAAPVRARADDDRDGRVTDFEEDGVPQLHLDAGTLTQGTTSYNGISVGVVATIARPPVVKLVLGMESPTPQDCDPVLLVDGRRPKLAGKPARYGGEKQTDMGGLMYRTVIATLRRGELARLAKARVVKGAFCADRPFTLRAAQRDKLRAFARTVEERVARLPR